MQLNRKQSRRRWSELRDGRTRGSKQGEDALRRYATFIPLGITTTPLGETKKRWRSSSGSYPIVVPGGISTFLSMIARRILQCRPICTFSNKMHSSTSVNELTRTLGESTDR